MTIDDLFHPDRVDNEVINELLKMDFVRVAQGHSAHVFGDTENRIVLKVFPPLSVGSAKELAFINRNPILRNADRLSLRWGNGRIVKWARQRAKRFLALALSRKNLQKRARESEFCIRAYEACIDKELMTRLPTRVVPNCMAKLSVRGHGWITEYLVKPAKIIMQKRFDDSAVAINVLQATALKGDAAEQCSRFVEKAIEYHLMMWRMGLVSTDLSFNIFDNLVVLPDGRLQLHDANDVATSLASALWFVHAKEEDIRQFFSRLDNGEYPGLLYDTDYASVAETARKLYQALPRSLRDDVVVHFLGLARNTLCESTLRENWDVHSPSGSLSPTQDT